MMKSLKGGGMQLFLLVVVVCVSVQSQLVLGESEMSGSGEEPVSEESVTAETEMPTVSTTPTIPATPVTSIFLPYGVENNDTLAPPALDEAFGPVVMDVPVVIFQNRETSFYVSSNGLISAQEPYTQFEPMVFSREFTEFTHSIIAPFWADFDSGRQGSIYYRATRDSVILQQIVDMISDIDPMYGNYTPSQAFIATWEDIIPFNLEGFILYNFQAIMATDGRTSFAIFLYGDVSILNAIDSQTGFNSGDGVEFSNIQVSSISRVNVYRIDGICIEKITASAPNCPLLANSLSYAFRCDLQQLTPDSCLCDSTASPLSDLCLALGFLPFGVFGDNMIPGAIDRSEMMELDMPFPYYQKRETKLFISTNGVLSFTEEFPDFIVSPVFPVSSVPLIAPLWADFDFRGQGHVFYRDTSHPEALIRAGELVTNTNEIYSDYSPEYVVIVTWSMARLFSNEIDTPITFQAVLSTDGTRSFATFIYNENLFQVQNIVSSGSGAIGFDAGDNSRHIRIASDTVDNTLQFINTFRIDGNCITNTSAADVCSLNSTSLECMNNEFRALSCLCPPGPVNNDKCRLTSFFPFGFGNNDVEGPRQVDASSHLTLGSDYDPIIFFKRVHKELYISTNGFISFGEELTRNSYIPVPFPRTDMTLGMLAPLWADFNFRNGGTLYYRIEPDEYILQVITKKLAKQNPAYASFHPTVAVVVTWFESTLFQNEIVTSFQVVLATDGDISFVLLFYEDYSGILDELLTFDIPYVSGFDAGDTVTSAQIVRNGNTTEFYYRIDGDCTVPVAMDICGLDSIPLSCVEMVTSSSCLCKPGFNTSDTCLDFLRFDEIAGDETIIRPPRTSRTQEIFSANLSLPTPVLFYGQPHQDIHIHVSGYISFGADPVLHSSCPFNLSSSPLPIISPVSSLDDNCLATALLHYRVQPQQTDTQTSSSQQTDTQTLAAQQIDAQTLSQVAARISNFNPELASFQPSVAVVATWKLSVSSTETTFVQSILVSDGNISFALFLYENPQEIATLLSQGILGFSAGNNSNVTEMEEIEDVNIFRIDGECITSAATGRVCGLNSVTAVCDSLNATTCTCNPGYKLDPMDSLICRDINECAEGLDDCSELQICANTDGGFTCPCVSGYQLVSDNKTCEDIDECLETGLHNCSDVCNNTEGGFFCSCQPGFEISDNGTCVDIDECEVELSKCSHTCNNTMGGYVCGCRAGFLLNSDGKTCTETVDRCSDKRLNNCSQRCMNTLLEGFICSCGAGFRLDDDNITCTAVSSGLELGLGISISLILIAITIAAVVGALVVIRQNRKKTTPKSYVNQLYELEILNPYTRHQHITVESSYSPNIPQRFLIASSKLTIGPSIGQGEFGVVYKGHIQHNYADNVRDTVAVKTLKGFVQRARVRELLKECAKMHKFDHPNVLKLIGVCLDGGPAPYIIMPFMANGNLLSYLKRERDDLIVEPSSSAYFDIVSVEKKLLDMCLQVAKGMEYLASKRVVHRDLAARNCMIDVNFVIKVADFGLAESMDVSKNYFRQTQEDVVRLPIKWLAPESINDSVFSEKSDVWAYGVTCWEVFSGGKTPYPGIHAMDLPHQLDNGMRLEKPLNAACTDEIYTMVTRCFHSDADQRPDFSELVNSVSSILVAVAEYVEFSPQTSTLVINPDS